MSAATRAIIAAGIIAAAWSAGGLARRWAGLALLAVALAPSPDGRSVAEAITDGLKSVATGFSDPDGKG